MATNPVESTAGQTDKTHYWDNLGQGDDGAAVKILGGKYVGIAAGSFSGSASCGFQYSPDGATYVAVTGGSLTAAGVVVLELPDGFVKPVLGSGDGSTDVNAWLKPIRIL